MSLLYDNVPSPDLYRSDERRVFPWVVLFTFFSFWNFHFFFRTLDVVVGKVINWIIVSISKKFFENNFISYITIFEDISNRAFHLMIYHSICGACEYNSFTKQLAFNVSIHRDYFNVSHIENINSLISFYKYLNWIIFLIFPIVFL